MDIESLKIKTRANYNWDDIVYINDFDSNLLEVIKRESRIVRIFIMLDMFLTHYMIIIL